MVAFAAIFACLLILSVSGPGGYKWSLFAIPTVLSIVAAVVLRRKTYYVLRPLFILSVMFPALVLLSMLPLPQIFDNFPPVRQKAQNAEVQDAVTKAGQLDLVDNDIQLFSASRNRGGTARMFLLALSAFAAIACASSMSFRLRQQCFYWTMLLAAGIGLAGYVSQHIVPQGKSIWWMFEVAHGRPVGCFLNRNHFGGFLALVAPVAAVLLARSIMRRRIWLMLMSTCCFASLSVAMVSSLSRGAWLSGVAGVAACMLYMTARWRIRLVVPLALTLLIAAAGIFYTSDQAVQERAESLVDAVRQPGSTLRLQTWKDALPVIADYPLAGTGLNAFEMVFPQYRSTSTRKTIAHVENEFIQLPLELGIPTCLVLAALVLLFVRHATASLPRQTEGTVLGRRTYQAILAGSSTAAAVHAFFDFSIRSPLYLLTFAVIAGCCLFSRDEAAGGACRHGPVLRAGRVWACAAAIAIVISFFHRQIMLYDSSDWIQTAEVGELSEALEWTPTSWQCWYHLGRMAIIEGGRERKQYGRQCMETAVQYDPKNYRLWHQLCLVRLRNGDREGALDAYRELKKLRSWVDVPQLRKEKGDT